MSQLSALRRSIKSSSSSRYACALERVGTTSSAGSLQPKITADPSARARTSACAGGDPDSVLVAEASSLMASSSTFLPSTWVQIKHSGENRPPCTAVTGSDEARTARVWGRQGQLDASGADLGNAGDHVAREIRAPFAFDRLDRLQHLSQARSQRALQTQEPERRSHAETCLANIAELFTERRCSMGPGRPV